MISLTCVHFLFVQIIVLLFWNIYFDRMKSLKFSFGKVKWWHVKFWLWAEMDTESSPKHCFSCVFFHWTFILFYFIFTGLLRVCWKMWWQLQLKIMSRWEGNEMHSGTEMRLELHHLMVMDFNSWFLLSSSFCQVPQVSWSSQTES